MSFSKVVDQYVICTVCGKNLGKYKENYGQHHLEKYPNHKSHAVINVMEPNIKKMENHIQD
jgi:hypothetical protein